MAARAKPPLWRCPKCGHRFVTRNMSHSCGRYRLAEHFRGKDPAVRRLFQAFMRVVRANGPVTMYAEKTRIVCMVRMRFAGALIRRTWIRPGIVLRRRAEHPTLIRHEFLPPVYHLHSFRIERASQMDAAFRALIREAYALGCQAGT